MSDQFDQIREQIHQIRNFLGPLEVQLESLDFQIRRNQAASDLKVSELESQISRQSSEIAQLAEQITQIKTVLNMLHVPELRPPAPVHEDKRHPAEAPPMEPPQ